MDALDNPFWASLSTLHGGLAGEVDGVRAYPPDVAPFLAIREPGSLSPRALDALVPAGQTALLLGPRPEVPAGWQREDFGTLFQMVCAAPLAESDGPAIVLLDERYRPAVLGLAALVYPHYFRPRTPELGRYFGILDGDHLVAMIGERAGMPGFREISAVCTHPDHIGRGLARRLLAHLANDLLTRDETPFLHVSPANDRAWQLYERSGFLRRYDIPFWAVRRDVYHP